MGDDERDQKLLAARKKLGKFRKKKGKKDKPSGESEEEALKQMAEETGTEIVDESSFAPPPAFEEGGEVQTDIARGYSAFALGAPVTVGETHVEEQPRPYVVLEESAPPVSVRQFDASLFGQKHEPQKEHHVHFAAMTPEGHHHHHPSDQGHHVHFQQPEEEEQQDWVPEWVASLEEYEEANGGDVILRQVADGVKNHLEKCLPSNQSSRVGHFIDVIMGNADRYRDDIKKLSNHLEVLKDNELDLADQELNKLQQKLNTISEQHSELVSSLQEENAMLHQRTEVMKDNELDLAHSELGHLQARWTSVFKAQAECIHVLSSQKQEMAGDLDKSSEENRVLVAQLETMKQAIKEDSEMWEQKFNDLENSMLSLEEQNRDLRRRSSEASDTGAAMAMQLKEQLEEVSAERDELVAEAERLSKQEEELRTAYDQYISDCTVAFSNLDSEAQARSSELESLKEQNRTLQESLTGEQEAAVSSLMAEKEQLSQELGQVQAGYEKYVADCTSAFGNFENEILALKEENKRLVDAKEEIEGSYNAASELMSERDNLNTELQEVKSAYEKYVAECKDAFANFESEARSRSNELQELREQKEQQQEEISRLQSQCEQLNSFDDTFAEINAEKDALTKKLETAQLDHESYVAECTNSFRNFENDAQTRVKEMETLKEQNSALQNQMETMSLQGEQVNTLNDAIAEISAEKDDLAKKLEMAQLDHENYVAECSNSFSNFENEVQTHLREMETLKEQKSSLQSQVETMSLQGEQLNIMQEEMGKLKEERDNLGSDLEQAQLECERLKSLSVEQSNEALSRLSRENDKLMKELKEVGLREDELRAASDKYVSALNNMEVEAQARSNELESLKEQNEFMRSEIEKLNASLEEKDQLNEELRLVSARESELKSAHDEYVSNFSNLESEAQARAKELEALKERNSELGAQVKSAVLLGEELGTERDRLKIELQQLQAGYEQYVAECTSAFNNFQSEAEARVTELQELKKRNGVLENDCEKLNVLMEENSGLSRELERVRAGEAELRSGHNQYMSEFEGLQNEVQAKDVELQSLKEQNSLLQESSQDIPKEISRLQGRCEELISDKNNLIGEKESLVGELEEAKRLHEQHLESSKNIASEMQVRLTEIEELKIENSSLKEQMEKANEERSRALSEEVDAINSDRARLHNELENLQASYANYANESKSSFDHFENEIQLRTNEIARLQTECEELDTYAKSMAEKVSLLESEKNDLEAVKLVSDEENLLKANSLAELEEIREENQRLQAMKEEYEMVMANVEMEIAAKESMLLTKDEEIASLHEQVQSMAQSAEVGKNSGVVAGEIEEAKQKIDMLLREKELLLADRGNMGESIFEQEIAALEMQLETSSAEYESMLQVKEEERQAALSDVKHLQEAVQSARQSEDRVRRESVDSIKEKDNRLQECMAEIEALRRELALTKKEFDQSGMNELNEQLRGAIGQWQAKDAQNEETILALESHLSETSATVETLNTEKLSWEGEMSVMKARLQDMIETVEERQSQVMELQTALQANAQENSLLNERMTSLQDEHLQTLSKLKNSQIAEKSKLSNAQCESILNMLTEIEDVFDLPTRSYKDESNCHLLIQSLIGFKAKVRQLEEDVNKRDYKLTVMDGELEAKDDMVRRLSSVQPVTPREMSNYVTPIEERQEELSEIEKLSMQVEELQEEAESYRQKCLKLELECEVNQRKRRLSGLEPDINGVYPTPEELAVINRALQCRCESLESELAKIKTSFSSSEPPSAFLTQKDTSFDYRDLLKNGEENDEKMQAYKELVDQIENVPELSSEEFLVSLQKLYRSGQAAPEGSESEKAEKLVGQMQETWQNERDVFWQKLNVLKDTFEKNTELLEKRIRENSKDESNNIAWEREKGLLLGEIRALKDMLKESVVRSMSVDAMNSSNNESVDRVVEAEKRMLSEEVKNLKDLLVQATESSKLQERLRLEEQKNNSVLKELFTVEKEAIVMEIRALRETESAAKEKLALVQSLEDQNAMLKGTIQTERDNHMRTLNNWNKEHEGVTGELRAELRKQCEQMERQQVVLEERAKALSDRETQLRELKHAYEIQTREFEESYKYQVDQEKSSLVRVQNLNETLKMELKETKERLERQSAEHKASTSSCLVMEHELQEAKGDIFNLESQLESLRGQLGNEKVQNIQLQGVCKEHELNLAEARREGEQLKFELEELKALKREQEQLGVTMKMTLENDKSGLMSELNSLKQKLHEVALDEEPLSVVRDSSSNSTYGDVKRKDDYNMTEQQRNLVTVHQAFSMSLQNVIQEALLVFIEQNEVIQRSREAIRLVKDASSSLNASYSRGTHLLEESLQQSDVVMETLKTLSTRLKSIQSSAYETDKNVMASNIMSSREDALREFSKHNLELSQTVMKQNIMISEYRSKISRAEQQVSASSSAKHADLSIHKEYKQLLLDKTLEIERLRNELRASVGNASKTMSGYHSSMVDGTRIQSRQLVADVNLLKASLRRSLNFRKALVYQKKYLLLLLGGYQQTYDNTLAYLGRIGDWIPSSNSSGSVRHREEKAYGDHQRSYSGVKERGRQGSGRLSTEASSVANSTPLNRFRVAAHAVRAMVRMRLLAKNWRNEKEHCKLLLRAAPHGNSSPPKGAAKLSPGGLVGETSFSPSSEMDEHLLYDLSKSPARDRKHPPVVAKKANPRTQEISSAEDDLHSYIASLDQAISRLSANRPGHSSYSQSRSASNSAVGRSRGDYHHRHTYNPGY
eukprot:Nk52_evm17s2085 gene=Nk52_evmTU17s2085